MTTPIKTAPDHQPYMDAMTTPTAADLMDLRDNEYRPALERIGAAIGYGNSCRILGELWDEMLESQYGIKVTRGRAERRPDIELVERLKRDLAAAQQEACTADGAVSILTEQLAARDAELAAYRKPTSIHDSVTRELHERMKKFGSPESAYEAMFDRAKCLEREAACAAEWKQRAEAAERKAEGAAAIRRGS